MRRIARHRTQLLKVEYPSLLRTGMSTKPSDELILRHFHCSRERRLCMITGASKPQELHLHNRGIHHVQTYSVVAHNGACERLCPGKNATSATVRSRRFLTARTRESAGLAQEGQRTPRQWTATGKSQRSAARDQGKRPKRHDKVVNDLDMHNNGHVNNQSRKAQFDTVRTCL